MEWLIVIGFIIVGVALVIVEILFIPGTTVFGILGIASYITSIVLAYSYFPSPTSHFFFIGSFVFSIGVIVLSFRGRSWDRFSLKESNTGKFNQNRTRALSVGEEGLSISNLRPMGKGEFNNVVYEVTALEGFVDSGKRIRILKVENRKILIEEIKS
jgi:membrane-bound ClpP family serine protease